MGFSTFRLMSLFVKGRKDAKRSFGEPSADLISPIEAYNTLEVQDYPHDPEAIRSYLGGIACSLIGEGC